MLSVFLFAFCYFKCSENVRVHFCFIRPLDKLLGKFNAFKRIKTLEQLAGT